MKLEYREIEIVSRVDGAKAAAKLCVCPACGGEVWLVYLVKDHPHLQCVECGDTFCQGGEECQL